MQLDDLLVRDIDMLRQEVASIDITAIPARTSTELDTVEMPHSSEAPVRVCADRASALPGQEGPSEDWPASEITACRVRAEEGHARSARRLAELLELTGQNSEAVAWWQRAADLGDQDAIAYLKEISRSG